MRISEKNKTGSGKAGFRFIVFFSLFYFSAVFLYAESIKELYLEETEAPLEVYRIKGKKAGKTLMVIGGIQGDESAGFLAADHYVDLSLKKGNLILVPRANPPSILENSRQLARDMNRCFADDSSEPEDYEARVVLILKALMAESDLVLNLHEGSGFYSPEWISEDRNPLRYGQSLIADAASYRKKNGELIELEKIALKAIELMNLELSRASHRFHFNNHKTLEKDSMHKEQRASATFYALTKLEIPAFGVETSKSLLLEDKLSYHINAINIFMDILDIKPEIPFFRMEEPVLDYLVIDIDNYPSLLVKKNENLELAAGTRLKISRVVANYQRGLFVRLDGFKDLNLIGRELVIEEPGRIRVFKDNQPCGSVGLLIRDTGLFLDSSTFKVSTPSGDKLSYKIRIDKEYFWIEDGASVDIPYGAIFEIVELASGERDPMDFKVNLKGFVPPVQNNVGEDRGYPVDTKKDLWLRYSEGGKGLVYPVETSFKGKKLGGFKIRLEKK